ncbi:MAG: biotin/lipoyl-containing protein [Candidatus Cryosericum sp.]
MSNREMIAMPDTVGSSLWLSLVDMLVVFAVLALLMFICYGLKFFSRGSRDQATADEEGDGQFDAAAGDETAFEFPAIEGASKTGESREQPSVVPAMPVPVHMGVDGAMSVGGLGAPTGQSRVFRITVNGKAFEVGVEHAPGTKPVVQSVSQVGASQAPVPQGPAVAPAALPVAFRAAPSHRPTTAANLMKSPLPGKILKVFAAPGKAFKRGDTLLIIEAMKMENEILAPRDCVVGEVHVEVNQSVKTGEPLLRME